jgi:hypothetical protein
VQEAQAQLVAVLCLANILFYPVAARLAAAMLRFSRLQKSHAALQKQAAGLSQEYTRATAQADAANASTPDVSASTAEVRRSASRCIVQKVEMRRRSSISLMWCIHNLGFGALALDGLIRQPTAHACPAFATSHLTVQAWVKGLEEQVAAAQLDKVTAERRLQDILLQTKNVEKAYDSLMREHAQLQRQASSGAFGSKKGD